MTANQRDAAAARTALDTVAEKRGATRRRSAWPLWLSVCVALSFGAYAGVYAYVEPGSLIEEAAVAACLLPGAIVWMLVCGLRGVAGHDALRLIPAFVAAGLLLRHWWIVDRLVALGLLDNRRGAYSAADSLIGGVVVTLIVLILWAAIEAILAAIDQARGRQGRAE